MSFYPRFRSALIAFLTLVGFAPAQAASVSIGQALFWEQSTDSAAYDMRNPLALRAEATSHGLTYVIEASQLDIVTNNSFVQIDRQQYELMGWAQKPFLQKDSFTPYLGAGLGTDFVQVKTTFQSDSKANWSRPEPVAGLSLGLRVQFLSSWIAEVEGRALASSAATPNPYYGVAGFIGYTF